MTAVDSSENEGTRQRPAVTRVTVRAGAVFKSTGQAEPRVLERDTEVSVVWLAFSRGEVSLFRLDDGKVIRVRYEDDRRGPRAG